MFEIFNTIFKYKEKQSPDQLGLYPERVHVEAMPERRYLWTSRVLVILSCLSISFNMMLAATIYLLLPQRTVYPRLFQINKYFSMLEQVQPAEINYPVSDLITEEHITEYIMLRYIVTSDYDELITRWAKGNTLYWYSARDVYDDFAKNDVQNNIMQFREKSLQRDVEIEWIKPLAKGLWPGSVPHTRLPARIRLSGYQHLACHHAHQLCQNPVHQARRRHSQPLRLSGQQLFAGLSRHAGNLGALSGNRQESYRRAL